MPKEMKILIPTTKIKESVKCKNTNQAYKIFRGLLDFEAVELKKEEHFWVMAVDIYGYVVCAYIASVGVDSRDKLDPVDIFSTAIMYKARKVFLAHNVPGVHENLNLDIKDLDMTNKLYHACLPFGVEIMDHIILSDNTYYSFAENIYMAIIHESPKYKTYNEVMSRIDKDKKDAKIEGIVEGKREEKFGVVEKMLLKNKSIEEISNLTELTTEDIAPIKEKFDNLISSIKSMLATNMDVRNIAEYTGLSVKYVEKIKKEMEK